MKGIQTLVLLVCCFVFALGGCAAEEELSELQLEAKVFSSWEELEQTARDGGLPGLDHYYVPVNYRNLPVDVIRVNAGYISVHYAIEDPTGTVYEGVEAEEAELLTTTVSFVWYLGDGEKGLKGYIESVGLTEMGDGVYGADIVRQSWPDTVLARECFWLGEDGDLFQLTLPSYEAEVLVSSGEWVAVEKVELS